MTIKMIIQITLSVALVTFLAPFIAVAAQHNPAYALGAVIVGVVVGTIWNRRRAR